MMFFFETVVVGPDGILSIALISTDALSRENVLIAICGPTAAEALARQVGSALERPENGAENGDATI
jgi:hypothetical protein